MSFFEGLVLLALVGGATKVIMVALEAVAPSATQRHAQLEEIWSVGNTHLMAGELEEADQRLAECIEKARDSFGGPTLHAARAWLDRAHVAKLREDHGAMARCARQAIETADALEDGAWYRARAREYVAEALVRAGEPTGVPALLDEAESIRIEWDPSSLAEHLDVRAHLAGFVDDLDRALRFYTRLVDAVAGVETVDEGGPYRAPPRSPRERLPLPAYWIERALAEQARVALLARRDELGAEALRRLVQRVRTTAPNPQWSRADRLIMHATRLTEYGLLEPAAELATVASGMASRHGSEARRAEAVLARDTPTLDVAAMELVARLAYERGDHDKGDALFERAGGALAPEHPAMTLMARASSLHARGRGDEALALAEAALSSVSAAEQTFWARWASKRGHLELADRLIAAPLEEERPSERLGRALVVSSRAADAGEFEAAERALTTLELPARYRHLRSMLAHQRADLALLRGRKEAARRRFREAAALRSSVGEIRQVLALACDSAEVGLHCDLERARAIGDERLPSRDAARIGWLHCAARERLADDDAQAALERAEAMAELHAFWFGDLSPEAPRIDALFADVFDALGRPDEALARARLALERRLAQHPPDHPAVAVARVELARRLPVSERAALLEPALQTLRAHGADGIEEVASMLRGARP